MMLDEAGKAFVRDWVTICKQSPKLATTCCNASKRGILFLTRSDLRSQLRWPSPPQAPPPQPRPLLSTPIQRFHKSFGFGISFDLYLSLSFGSLIGGLCLSLVRRLPLSFSLGVDLGLDFGFHLGIVIGLRFSCCLCLRLRLGHCLRLCLRGFRLTIFRLSFLALSLSRSSPRLFHLLLRRPRVGCFLGLGLSLSFSLRLGLGLSLNLSFSFSPGPSFRLSLRLRLHPHHGFFILPQRHELSLCAPLRCSLYLCAHLVGDMLALLTLRRISSHPSCPQGMQKRIVIRVGPGKVGQRHLHRGRDVR
ncbi:hypothetical protein BC834DRAFT_399943 [Gloeopeniophorella convolvens]|nr:hypothetical protein BC834DRAFT_399943 [Gloeopeniophorella convolvens]